MWPRSQVLIAISLAVTGSILYAAPVLYDSLGFLAFVATMPWLVLLTCRSLSFRIAATLFLASVYGMGLLALPWLRSFNAVAWVVAPLFYVPLFLLIAAATRVLRSAWPQLPLSVLWAVTFTGGEYLRIRLSAGEIPFAQLGACLISFDHLIQGVDIVGVWGLTFLATFVTGHILDCAAFVRNPFDRTQRAQLTWVTLGIAAVIASATAYGWYRDRPGSFIPGPRVLLVQPNFPTWDVTPAIARARLDKLAALTRGDKARDVELVVWPENSVIPFPPLDVLGRGVSEASLLQSLAKEMSASIVVDGPTADAGARPHHTASLVYQNGRTSDYHKRLLVPWSECVPYENILRRIHPPLAEGFVAFVRARNPHLRSFDAGTDATIFRVPSGTGGEAAFVAPICYETLSASYMRRWVARAHAGGAGRLFIVNPVNEKLLGNDVHGKTLSFCRFRAIEMRMTVLRAANNGISAAIDPNGHVYAVVRGTDGAMIDRAGTIAVPVIFDRRFGTLYTRYGDWLPAGCLIAWGGACCWIALRRRMTRALHTS